MNIQPTDRIIMAILNLSGKRFWVIAIIGLLAAAGYLINAVKWW
ncbi:hypothetical protein [Neisseria dentiae]|nr:hypothetical protein [Neisseria dentiae]STZ50946.1 Uncharacterised protein [Neisseria dentiae]